MSPQKIPFSFHSSDLDLEEFRFYADLCGLSLSEYARLIIVGKTPLEKTPPDLHQVIHQLKRILSNLNQISTMSVTFDVSEAGLAHAVASKTRARVLRIRKEVSD